MIKPTTYFIGKYKVKGIENYSTLEECYEYLKDKKFIGIDIETSAKTPQVYAQFKKNKQFRPGLDPYLTKIVMLQLGNYEKIFVIDVRDYSKEELQPIINFLDYNKDITLIGQNLKFEQKHLKHNYGINFYNVVDIMIQEMCLYNGLYRSFSLAGMSKEYLGVKSVSDFSLFDLESRATLDDEFLSSNEHLLTPFEIADEEQIDKGTRMEFVTIYDKPFTAKQILYGSDDILYPLLIAERQRLGRQLPNGEVYKPLTLFKLENQMVLVNADMELNGMPFKESVWRDIEREKHKEYTERLKELNSYVEHFYPKFVEEPNLFDFHRRCKVEWGSSKQVIELFRFLGVCPKEFSKQTKKEEWTVGAVALLKLVPNELKDAYNNQQWIGFDKDESGSYIEDHNKLILAYLLMKRSEQAVTTFGLEWLKYVHPITGRIHSNFRQILNSGRMASNNPNIQNLPTGVYRDAFALDSGSVISSDFGNQEMRTAACISGEEVMLQVFTEGHPVYDDDLHMATADSMNKALNPNAEHLPKKGQEGFTNEIKKQRDRAKIVNFGILYGKEAKGFAQDFGMELEEAEDFIKNYFKAYPKLQVMMDKQAKDTFKNNYILINPMTDRRWFSSLFDEMNDYREKASEYFPEEYFSNRMPKEQKLKLKEELNAMYPEIKTYWRNFFGIRGSIQRKSTNYLVQGCIPASSNILTDKGFCKIGDFESGTVWTGYNWAPANKVARGEAEIIKLTLSNGYEFICDDRHKLLGLNSKGEEQMFDVLDMVGEKIIIDLKKSNCEWGSPINSVEDWYWFGRLVGDGWVTKRGHWGIIFNKNEYEDMNAFCQWLDSKDLITKTSPKTYKGYNIFYSNSKTKKACTREESTYCSVSLSSEDSHKLLKMWNIDKGFSSNKHLPPIVFSLDFERRKALFKGWYDADGRKYPSRGGIILDGKKYTRLSCSNKVLQQSLLKLTTTLGFLSKIFNYKNSTDIYFYTKPQQIFVKSIDYLGYKEETYTLTVHDHLHRFSNEGLISKNTSADETKTALVMIRKNFIEKNTHLKLINSVHDEILVETTNEKEEAIKDGELLAKLMVDGANVYLTPKIMTSNPEVGSCWVH